MNLLVAIICNACACGAAPAYVPACDAPQWVRTAPGVLALKGTGFTITWNAQNPDSLAVAGPGVSFTAGTIEEAEQKATQTAAQMRAWGMTP